MKEIYVNGKPLPVHFGMGALREYSKKKEQEFDSVLKGDIDTSLDGLYELVAVGLNHGARYAKTPERYTAEDAEFMIDDDPKLINKVMEVYTESVEVLMSELGSMADLGNPERPKTKNPRAESRKK